MVYARLQDHRATGERSSRARRGEHARSVRIVETVSFSRQGINGNLPVGGAKRGLPRLVEMSIVKVEEAAKAFSSHSLRVRVTRDCLWPVRMAWGLPKHLFDRRRRRHMLGAEACRGQQCRSVRVLLKLTS